MGLFDKVGSFIKREAEDIGEVAERARDRLDEKLTEAEEELEMTPTEKLRALQRKGRETDERFDEIVDKAEARAAGTDAQAEVAEAAAPAPVDLGEDAPNVTHIVLADGSVRSGDDPPEPDPEDEEIDETPEAGDLSWVAPQEGEEAVVPAFQGRVGTVDSSDGATEISASADVEEPPALAPLPGSSELDPEPLAPETPDPSTVVAEAPEPAPVAPAPLDAPTAAFQAAATSDVLAPDLGDLPAPPQAPVDPVETPVTATESAAQTPAQSAEDIAGRALADVDVDTSAAQAAATDMPAASAVPTEPGVPVEEPVAATVPTERVPEPQAKPEPAFEKTPAQIKYELAREAADALLDELRGELKADGEI